MQEVLKSLLLTLFTSILTDVKNWVALRIHCRSAALHHQGADEAEYLLFKDYELSLRSKLSILDDFVKKEDGQTPEAVLYQLLKNLYVQILGVLRNEIIRQEGPRTMRAGTLTPFNIMARYCAVKDEVEWVLYVEQYPIAKDLLAVSWNIYQRIERLHEKKLESPHTPALRLVHT